MIYGLLIRHIQYSVRSNKCEETVTPQSLLESSKKSLLVEKLQLEALELDATFSAEEVKERGRIANLFGSTFQVCYSDKL